MWERVRDIFGNRAGLRAELDRIRLRVEHLESVPILGARVDTAENRAAILADRADTIDARCTVVESDVDALHEGRKEMIVAISEGIERTDRAERRVKNTIRRARRELEELGYTNPGLEAEADEFREVDGDGSNESGLRALPEKVAPDPQPSSIRGVSLETLRSARGF